MNRCTSLVAATLSTVAFLAPALCFSSTPTDDVVLDTLSLYVKTSGFVAYEHPSIMRQAARFQTAAPASLRRISLLFSGAAGTAVLRICGHEGGLSAPILGKDLHVPILLKKEREGLQQISVDLGDIPLQNDQFFIVVEQISTGVRLLSDRQKAIPACIAPHGEKYVYQYLQKADNTWEYGAYSFAIDVEIALPKIEEPVFYQDTAAVVVSQSATACRSIASADINNDGYLDLLAAGRLYINNGRGRFLDNTESFGLQGTPQAHCFIDMDNDGNTDILFLGIPTQSGADSAAAVLSHTLYMNQGKGRMKKLPLELPALYAVSSFSVADITGDGYADLFVGQCLQPGAKYPVVLKNYVLVNSQKLSFQEKTSLLAADEEHDFPSHAAVCRGSSFVDLNNDNLTDLYIANYYGHSDELWFNTGSGFERRAVNVGTDTTAVLSVDGVPVSPEWYSSGCHWMDADNNGTPDLLSTRYLNPLYVKRTSTALSSVRTSYAVSEQGGALLQQHSPVFDYDERHSAGVWGDVNNDGRPDCLLLTSCECSNADFYQQQEGLNFSVESRTYGLESIVGVNDALWMDVNNDGALDLIFVKDTLVVYRNRGRGAGHYVQIDLQSGRSTAGAKVQVFTSTGMYTQQISSGRGLLMQDPLRLHFGLSESEKIDSARVVWPGSGGYWETYTSVEADRVNVLKEGSGTRKNLYEQNLMKIVGVRSYPNPFRESVNIEFQLLESAHVVLEIYDLQGNLVGSVLDSPLEAGTYKSVWNGQSSNGLKLPAGSYMYHCTVGEAKVIGKIVLVN